jgi:hypothetical protein
MMVIARGELISSVERRDFRLENEAINIPPRFSRFSFFFRLFSPFFAFFDAHNYGLWPSRSVSF